MKLKTRLIVTGLTMWIVIMALCLSSGSGAFFSQMANGTCDYYTMTHSDLQKNLPVNGTCYVVYDCIATYVTSETNKTTGKTTETDSAYYYVVPLDEEYFMLVKTRANSQLTEDFDRLVDAFWYEDESPYYDMLDTGAKLDGILVKNDSKVVNYYNEWIEEMELKDESYLLSDYTLDCTKTVAARIKEFWVGMVLLLAFLGTVTAFVVSYFKKKRVSNYSPSAASYSSPTYGSQPFGMYDPTATFGSTHSTAPQSNFQSHGVQSSTDYGTSNYGSTTDSTYGQGTAGYSTSSSTPSGSSYGQFQSQGGQGTTGYGTSSYSTPSSSSYGQFPSQGGQGTAGYGTSSYSTPSSSSYGQFQSQSGQGTTGYVTSSYGTPNNSTYGHDENTFGTQNSAANDYSSNYDNSNQGY